MNPWIARDAWKAALDDGLPVKLDKFPGWIFYVRQQGDWNKYFQRAVARISADKKVRDYLERAGRPDYVKTPGDLDLDERIAREAFAEGCVVKWEGVTGRDGEPLAFSVKAAKMLLETFPDIFAGLMLFSSTASNYPPVLEIAKAELAEGNSAPASST